MQSTQAPHIFLSYARADTDFARRLRDRLIAEGLDPPWHDLTHMSQGDWQDQIERVLTLPVCEYVVLVLSPAALAEHRHLVVKWEWKLARREGKTVLPVEAPGGLGPADRALMPGWMRKEHAFNVEGPDGQSQFANLVAALKVIPGQQTRRPIMVPDMPAGFIPRPAQFDALKSALLDAKSEAVAITAALRGAGGFGKTVLAQALAHDDEIIDAFYDGILWVSLGEKPRPLEALNELLTSLSGERQAFTEVSAAKNRLKELLAGRKRLLVIDDVWRQSDLELFLEGGKQTARLVTTRLPELLPAGAVKVVVDKMAPDEALALLRRGLPAAGLEEEAALTKLATDGLRNWPVLIGIVNGMLCKRTTGDNPERLQEAIDDVATKLDTDGVLGFDVANEPDRNKSVARTIDVGLDMLDGHDATRRKGGVTFPAGYHRARYHELALYPEDVEIPIATIGHLWGARGVLRASNVKVQAYNPRASPDEQQHHEEEVIKRREAITREAYNLVERFYRLALVEALNRQRKTIRVHDVMRKYLAEQQAETTLHALHCQFIEAYDAESGPDIADPEERRYFYTWLPTHLYEAGKGEQPDIQGRRPLNEALNELLLDPQWMQRKLNALAGPLPLVLDYERLVPDLLSIQGLIGRTLRLITGIISRDRKQLIPQLAGRLMISDDLMTLRFVDKLRRHLNRPAIVMQSATLTPPGVELARLEAHHYGITGLVALTDGRLASSSMYENIRIWDASILTEIGQIPTGEDVVTALCVLPDNQLAIGSYGKIRIWDASSCEETIEAKGFDGSCAALVFFPGGQLVRVGGFRKVEIWDVNRSIHQEDDNHETSLSTMEYPEGSWTSALARLSDGRLAIGDQNGVVYICCPATGANSHFKSHEREVTSLVATPSTDNAAGLLVSGSLDGTIQITDIMTYQRIVQLTSNNRGVTAMQVMDANRLVSGRRMRLAKPTNRWVQGRGGLTNVGHPDYRSSQGHLSTGV